MPNFQIITQGDHAVAIFPSSIASHVDNLLTLLMMPEYTPYDLVCIRLVKFEKWDKLEGTGSRLLNKVRDVRESCKMLELSPRHNHFRASLKECRDFVTGEIAITIPRGFIPIIRDIGIEFEEL